MKLRNAFLGSLAPLEFALLDPHLVRAPLEPQAVIVEKGQLVARLYFPTTSVFSLTMTQHNQATEVATVGYEGVVGLLNAIAGQPAAARTTVLFGGEAWAIDAATFREQLASYPSLQDAVFRHLQAREAARLREQLCASEGVEAKLSGLLLLAAERIGALTIPVTQSQLADSLKVQRSTVTVIAQSLKHRGFFDYRRGILRIQDIEALRQLAGPCYSGPLTGFAFGRAA